MSFFGARLREERKRLGLNQAEFAALGGVTVDSQGNYERGSRKPDADYLEAIAAHDVDVAYVLTGHRMLMQGYVAPAAVPEQHRPAARLAPRAAEPPPNAGKRTVLREVTPEEAALLDNYEASDEQGRAAARSVLDALAKQKAA